MRLTWSGNIQAEAEARKAYLRLKPGKKQRRRLRKECRAKLRKAKARKTAGWQPKNAREYAGYLKSRWWAKRRQEAVEKAGSHCQACGSINALEVHHISYQRLYREKDADLQVLCRACHEDAGLAGVLGVSLDAFQQHLSGRPC